MRIFKKAMQYPMCMVGMHVPPPQRYPNGPVIATCPCCGKTSYYFGLSAYGLGGPPVLIPTVTSTSNQLEDQ